MPIPFGHHQLHNRYRFRGRLQLVTPLRLSSGTASEVSDAPLMRDRAGTIYIPGSSLRGAVRSELERVLAAVGTAAGLSACTLFTDAGSDPGACLSASKAKRDKLGALGDEEEAAAYVGANLCDLCKLFGSAVYASRLVIEDAYPAAGSLPSARTQVRDGVGIDRDTGTAAEGVKFNFEVLEPGVGFELRLEVENVGDKDRLLLDLVLSLLRQGLTVGGKRAAGLGRVQLAGELAVSGFDGAAELWQALEEGRDPHAPVAWKGGA
jgi:CRISPR-associated RAMP protein (TIGR02581 family)